MNLYQTQKQEKNIIGADSRRSASSSAAHLEDNRPQSALKKQQGNSVVLQKKENKTGLPDQLKSGIEHLSGYSMNDVKVHYNSNKPAQFEAHAYAQGTNIHIAPGQEKHLPHEAWHVAQQKQGRVNPTVKFKQHIAVNDSPVLEHEADRMGAKALQHTVVDSPESLSTASPAGSTIQRTVWEWKKNNRWVAIGKDTAMKGPPRHNGTRVGELYDDTLTGPVGATATAIRPPVPAPSLADRRIGVGQPQAVQDERIDALKTAKASGQKLTKLGTDQLTAGTSNAAHLRRIIGSIPAAAQQAATVPGHPLPHLLDQWNATTAEFSAHAGNSVFTRDVDQGELSGQPITGGTMNTVSRAAAGIGRIRTKADLNRGGGGASYVRFVADKARVPDEDGVRVGSKALNVGSIAASGVTMIYDPIAVMQHNSTPAAMAYNKQDSAGRVFGTSAATPEELRRQGKQSERLLGQSNPDYYKREFRPIPVRTLTPEEVIQNAIDGVGEMARQAREGQTDQQEYNEALAFNGASVGHVKSILIHKPAVTKGRPPVMTPISAEDQAKFTRKEARRFPLRNARERAELEQQQRELLEQQAAISQQPDSPMKPHNLREIGRKLVGLTAALDRVKVKKPQTAMTEKAVKHLEPSTSAAVRNPGSFDGGALPQEMSRWEGVAGHGGIPVRYMIRHVNPTNTTRQQLPELAAEVYAEAQQKHAAEQQREAERAVRREQLARQTETLSITGQKIVPGRR